ncbi:tetratricopeptide repeat protein [Streptomyces lydicus]|uniref:tetratricopeptide repeat protein n=1 Tax=Streptomyces lydicus TaxID=47763 RepID=UPI00101117A2|nr:tetratricopeptide repeat protein [Streptomyces lydicus]
MSPPMPPPLRRARCPGAPVLTPALEDAELALAAEALTLGQWARVRTLLAGTGAQWDLRGHRLTVLATCPGSAAWAGDWLLAEPDSGDAATLLALATVHLALRGESGTGTAIEACATAARMLPDDPTPWLGALILARRTGTPGERAHAFRQVCARHRDHHHAHHLMTASLAEQLPGVTDDPRHPVHVFAARAAARAPADSPLALLPVVAYAERYRVLAAAGLAPPDPADWGHWSTRRARQVLQTAVDWWLEWEGEEHPRRKIDLNFLAHAAFHQGRTAEAATLFQRIGPHATRAPWSYPGRDGTGAFRAARATALCRAPDAVAP